MDQLHAGLVRLTACDSEVASTFALLKPTLTIGLRRFPGQDSYRDAIEVYQTEEEGTRIRVFAAAQRDWHIRGQSGCQFARLAALQAATLPWDFLISDPHIDAASGRILDAQIRACITGDTQILSLLFPTVMSAAQLEPLIRDLCRGTGYWLEDESIDEDGHQFKLRYSISASVRAWVMLFGPFDFLPRTRQAPITELVMRTAVKPDEFFHRLNPDASVAHLADVPLEMSSIRWEHRWKSTGRRTRMVLNAEPDRVSAAKATLTIPREGI